MADELRERIRHGDLAAFFDPALELRLLAELNADWWEEGAYVTVCRCVRLLLARVAIDRGTEAIDAWCAELRARRRSTRASSLPPPEASPAYETHEQWEKSAWLRVRYAQSKSFSWARTNSYVDLARRLRTLAPSAPPEVDAALAVLERHAREA